MAKPLKYYSEDSYNVVPGPTAQTSDERFREQRAGQTIDGAHRVLVTNRGGTTAPAATPEAEPQTESAIAYSGPHRASVRNRVARARKTYNRLNKRPALSVKRIKSVAKQGKAVGTFASICAWGFSVYVLQFKAALILLIAIGLGGILSEVLSYFTSDDDAGFFESAFYGVVSFVGDSLVSILSNLLRVFGIVIPDPADTIEGLLGIFLFLPFIIGVGTLLAMSIQYSVTLHNAFGGQKAGLKLMCFVLALIGYFIPILNLLPWFFPWAWVVMRHPK